MTFSLAGKTSLCLVVATDLNVVYEQKRTTESFIGRKKAVTGLVVGLAKRSYDLKLHRASVRCWNNERIFKSLCLRALSLQGTNRSFVKPIFWNDEREFESLCP